MSPIVAHSEHPSQDQQIIDGHEYRTAADGSGTNNLNELSTLNTQLHEGKSEKNAHSTKNVKAGEKSKDLTSRKFSTLQSHLSSSKSSAHLTQEMPTKLVPKNSCSRTNQASPPKTSRAAKPPKQNALVPPPVSVAAAATVAAAAAAPDGLFVPKEPDILPSSDPAQLQSAPNQSDMNSKSRRTSKLRPPTVSFRPKQMTRPKVMVPFLEYYNTRSQTSHSRQLTQAKENMQNEEISVRSGDGVPPNRHSRLPKPKTY